MIQAESTFPPEIRRLPRFDGPITAHRLAADRGDVLFATYPAGTTIPPHHHDTHNVGVVLAGRLHLTVNGTEAAFDPGDWYRLPATTEHAARFDEHTELIEIWFTAEETPTIRTAAAADAAAIATVLADAFREAQDRYTPAAFEATTPNAATILDRLSEGPIWIALRDHRVVATISATRAQDTIRLRSLAVAPTERETGLGRRLVDEAIGYAAGLGVDTVTAETTPFLDRAQRLYEQLGFEPDDPPTGDLHGTPLLRLRRSSRAEN